MEQQPWSDQTQNRATPSVKDFLQQKGCDLSAPTSVVLPKIEKKRTGVSSFTCLDPSGKSMTFSAKVARFGLMNLPGIQIPFGSGQLELRNSPNDMRSQLATEFSVVFQPVKSRWPLWDPLSRPRGQANLEATSEAVDHSGSNGLVLSCLQIELDSTIKLTHQSHDFPRKRWGF